MITDTIDRQWLDEVNEIADLVETLDRGNLILLTSDQLHYLIYWNFGYSGITECNETKWARNELADRGIVYNETLAESIANYSENFY